MVNYEAVPFIHNEEQYIGLPLWAWKTIIRNIKELEAHLDDLPRRLAEEQE